MKSLITPPWFFLLFAVFSHTVFGQSVDNPILVTGTVTDHADGKPIEFVAVSLRGKSRGTITNAEGNFTLRLPAESANDTLYISMVGYQSVNVPISTIHAHLAIKMHEQPILLHEVEITGTKITVDDILKSIKANVKRNYPVDEYAMECFYREIKKENGTYKSLLEAALVVRDKSYDQQKSPESAYVREIRGSSRYVNPYSDFWQDDNLWRETMGLNAVRHPANIPNVFGRNKYQVQGVSTLNDKEVYVLVSDMIPDFGWQRTLYVDVDTYAIYRSEEVIADFSMSWKVSDNDTISFKMTKGVSTFDFKEYKGRLYASHLRFEADNQYFNPKTGKVYDTFTIINDLMVSEIYDEPASITDGLRKLENIALEKQLTSYNESFWRNYNAVMQTPLQTEVMQDLVKNGDLNRQFVESVGKVGGKKKKN